METFNQDAKIMNLEGQEVLASSVLCTALPIVIMGLEAIKALSKKWFVKFCIGVVITAVNGFAEIVCKPPTP